jgi:MraZ protein
MCRKNIKEYRMFSGQYNISLNSIHKFTLPQRFGDMLAQGAVITQGFDRNLMVLSRQAFQSLTERILSMNLTDPTARMLLRMILGNANDISLDETGQMDIPEKLYKMVDLQSDSVLVGMGDFFEIWPAEGWSEQEMKITDQEADPNRYSSLHLAIR